MAFFRTNRSSGINYKKLRVLVGTNIFLCHSGAQKDFAHRLWVELKAQHRYAFLDIESLPFAHSFPNLIFNTITRCEVFVMVLSEEFFSRSIWPMLELQICLQARESGMNPNLKLLPLFLRISTEEVKDAENKKRWLKKWHQWAATESRIDLKLLRKALRELKATNGLVFKSGMREVEYIERIVELICEMVPPYITADLTYVQGAERISQGMIQRINHLACNETRLASVTRILAVYGRRGMGKATLCKIMCNYFRRHCKVCHIQVGDGDVDHLTIQKFVLKQLTGASNRLLESITNSEEGQNLLVKRINKLQVFLAIDNVCTTESSTHITRMLLRLPFTKDSLVLVTACNYEELLEVIGYDISGNCFHLPNLTEEEAIQILLQRAIPNCNFASLTDSEKQIIRYCTSLSQISCNIHSDSSVGESQITELYHYHPSSLIKMGARLGGNSNNWSTRIRHVVEHQFSRSRIDSKAYIKNQQINHYKPTARVHHARAEVRSYSLCGSDHEGLCTVHRQRVDKIASKWPEKGETRGW